MKTISLKVCSIFFASLLLTAACKDDSTSSDPLSTEETADIAASTLAENSAGLTTSIDNSTSETDYAVDNPSGRVASCGYTKDSVFTIASTSGALITYSYSFEYSYTLSCGLSDPQSLTATISSEGSFDGTRLASQHSATGSLVITALDKTATSYLVNGTYARQGTFQSKIGNKATSTSTITVNATNITVDKNTKAILSGSADLTITGTVTGKGSFSTTATITFNGDKKATLVIKGKTYTINLLTGETTAA